MTHSFFDHIREVRAHFAASDVSLGQRRLIDCALETQDDDIFRNTLQFFDWLETQGKDAPPAAIQEKANALLDLVEKKGVPAPVSRDPVVLTADNIRKTYTRGNFTLSNLSLRLELSQITGLVGENGNGKTTLLRLLAAELKPDRGTISYHLSPTPRDQYDLRTRLVYIEQRIPRWHGSLMDNLLFTLAHHGYTGESNRLRAEMLIARLGLRPYKHLTWGQISSGYRTRFELAKTLLRRPQVLLLDEPLANLDIISQQTILQDLKFMSASLSAPFSMILSSQHIYEVEKVSDRIIFLKNGAPQYQESASETARGPAPLIFEMETAASREELQQALEGLPLQKVQYNGGVYLLHFAPGTESPDVLARLAARKIEIGYFRNISRSSRRFFLN